MTFFLATACYAGEQRTVRTYKRHINSAEHRVTDLDHNLHHMLYLTGINDGYALLNKQLTGNGEPLLYCQPDTMTLSGQDTKEIFEKFIYSEENQDTNNLSIPEAMLLALKQEFPCL